MKTRASPRSLPSLNSYSCGFHDPVTPKKYLVGPGCQSSAALCPLAGAPSWPVVPGAHFLNVAGPGSSVSLCCLLPEKRRRSHTAGGQCRWRQSRCHGTENSRTLEMGIQGNGNFSPLPFVFYSTCF